MKQIPTNEWRPSSHGAGKERWRVVRNDGRETLKDERGNYRRFANAVEAQLAADKANSKPAEIKKEAS